jgi:hypothetical protein
MDPRPDDIRAQIAGTRASLGRHLDELGAEIDERKARAKQRLISGAQYWGAVSAVVFGLLGAVILRPRRTVRRRRVLRSFQRATVA